MSDLTPKMVTALTSATFMESAKGLRYSDAPGVYATGWNIPRSTHAATLRAMVKRGLVMGDGGLTERGVEVRASYVGMEMLTTPSVPVEATQSPVETRNPLVGIKLYDGTFRGLCSMSSVGTYMGEVYGDTSESMELCANCEETLDRCANLTRYAEEEKDMEPLPVMEANQQERMRARDKAAQRAMHDQYGTHNMIMGKCTSCGAEETESVDVLAESIATMHEPYIGVRQGRKGFTAVEHIHAPGCGDIAKELKRFRGDTFDYAASMTLADIIAANWADVASDDYGDDVMENADAWRDMVGWMRDAHSGVKIMACAKDMIGGECPAGEVFRASDGFPRIKPRTGVVDCADCGEHIMSDDMSIPATCEGGCDAPAELDTVRCVRCGVHGDMSLTPKDTEEGHVCGYCADVEEWSNATDNGANLTPTAPVESVEAPTLTTYDVRLSVAVGEGVTIDLGWHTFTVADVTMIPDAYGAANGEWSRPGTPDWASIITVDECYAL